MITRWIKPVIGRVKLNSDEYSKGGHAGGGCLLRK